ncbi:hypothetical protein PRIO_4947 [Paenibacillus riograndensis SBR5]|uniref:Uncharacterized protein n=1 Tax=Paenibacillus riograndensis SBR5 TaxID=1073571 RepID=A0A0E4CYC4_9BACL|nr:hypothetical protein PRIO_4947 [Paenibacillus riograndensis SBR5]
MVIEPLSFDNGLIPCPFIAILFHRNSQTNQPTLPVYRERFLIKDKNLYVFGEATYPLFHCIGNYTVQKNEDILGATKDISDAEG